MSKNLHDAMQRMACEESARFITEHLPKARAFETPQELRTFAIQEALKVPGLFAEFGVFGGDTINEIAAQTDRTVYGFDSFDGLPENWRTGFHQGAFATGGLPAVAGNVKLIKGLFAETLPAFFDEQREPAAFLHCDADLYSSTVTILECATRSIQVGTVIVFDEMFNYPGWKTLGEYRAWMEFATKRNIQFHWLGYCFTHEQVAVVID